MRSNSLKKFLFCYPIHCLTEVFGRISQFSMALFGMLEILGGG